jgi:hypothetical protein
MITGGFETAFSLRPFLLTDGDDVESRFGGLIFDAYSTLNQRVNQHAKANASLFLV